MENQPKQPVSGEEKEVDLGLLFTVFTRMANSVLSGLKSLFTWLFEMLILFLLFLKRRILLLIVGLLLSLVPGLYRYLSRGTQYFSSMTVRANFGSVHEVYNKIDYFNSLIKLGDTKKLADIFHLSELEAGQLYQFEIEPVDDEMQVTELYRKTFYDPERSLDGSNIETGPPAIARDTSWMRLMRYADFKKNLTVYDFPIQKISLYTQAPGIFPRVGEGLQEVVSGNKSLEASRRAEDSILHEQTDLILSSLSGADSLMKAFSKKIESGDRHDASTLSISPQAAQNPEIELFDKQSDLRKSLSGTRKYVEDHRDILQVISEFNAAGTPIAPFKESFLQYSLWCLLGSIALLLLFEGYLKLGELEKRRKVPAKQS
jgi:hypothetical protein